jgi:hypothetical protein
MTNSCVLLSTPLHSDSFQTQQALLLRSSIPTGRDDLEHLSSSSYDIPCYSTTADEIFAVNMHFHKYIITAWKVWAGLAMYLAVGIQQREC